MSRVFLTKLRCSSGRVKWLRLEQRPFNYFVARTHTAQYTQSPARTHAHATIYVWSHLIAGKSVAFDARERLHVSALFTEASFFEKASHAKPFLTVFSPLLFEMTISVFWHYRISQKLFKIYVSARYYFQLNQIQFRYYKSTRLSVNNWKLKHLFPFLFLYHLMNI